MNFEPWLVGITINGVLIALIRNCATDGVMVSALAGLVGVGELTGSPRLPSASEAVAGLVTTIASGCLWT